MGFAVVVGDIEEEPGGSVTVDSKASTLFSRWEYAIYRSAKYVAFLNQTHHTLA
jgi:hypothetical protein